MLKKTKRRIKKYNDAKSIFQTLRSPDKSSYHSVVVLEDKKLLFEAQKLHAQVYLSRNFIIREDLGEDNRMHINADPHQKHAVYFSVIDKNTQKVVGTSRQIEHHNEKSFNSFPLLKKSKINPEWREYIKSHNPETIIEISGLSKLKNVSSIVPLYLYRQMWHHSIAQDHKLWLMACDVRLFQRLKIILGDAIIQIGKETKYPGGNVIPAIVKPQSALNALIYSTYKSKKLKRYTRLLVLEFFIDGLSVEYFTSEEISELEKMGFEITKRRIL